MMCVLLFGVSWRWVVLGFVLTFVLFIEPPVVSLAPRWRSVSTTRRLSLIHIYPNSVHHDFAGIKNWFNEFYARDTSRKIRAVQKAKGERGVPLTVNVPSVSYTHLDVYKRQGTRMYCG